MAGVLEGRIAIVTGAGQGIGQGIARAFAKEGALLAIVGRTESKLHETAAQIGGAADGVLVLARDLSSRGACNEVAAATVRAFGTVDILVNNAASTSPVPLMEITDEQFESDLVALRAT